MDNEKHPGPQRPKEDVSSSPNNSPFEHPLPIHNPLDPNDPKTISPEDLENEQKYKEALTERD